MRRSVIRIGSGLLTWGSFEFSMENSIRLKTCWLGSNYLYHNPIWYTGINPQPKYETKCDPDQIRLADLEKWQRGKAQYFKHIVYHVSVENIIHDHIHSYLVRSKSRVVINIVRQGMIRIRPHYKFGEHFNRIWESTFRECTSMISWSHI